MPTLQKVTDILKGHEFCLTDCGPSDGCNPDDSDDDNFAPTTKRNQEN